MTGQKEEKKATEKEEKKGGGGKEEVDEGKLLRTGQDNDIEGSRRGPRRPKKTSISKAIKSIAILCSRFLRSNMLKEYQQ